MAKSGLHVLSSNISNPIYLTGFALLSLVSFCFTLKTLKFYVSVLKRDTQQCSFKYDMQTSKVFQLVWMESASYKKHFCCPKWHQKVNELDCSTNFHFQFLSNIACITSTQPWWMRKDSTPLCVGEWLTFTIRKFI